MDYRVIVHEQDLRKLPFNRFKGHWQKVRHETCKILFENMFDNGKYLFDNNGILFTISFDQRKHDPLNDRTVHYSIGLWDIKGTHSLGGVEYRKPHWNEVIPKEMVNEIVRITDEYNNGNATCNHCKKMVPMKDGQRFGYAGFRCGADDCKEKTKKAMRHFTTF